MRMTLILIGAAVVAYLITLGIRAFIAQQSRQPRRTKK